jgi:tetratricopeptide (TPR) repeat protein
LIVGNYTPQILTMSNLFKEISESKYGEWALYAIGGLVSVSVFPTFPLGWLCLNIVIFHFLNTMSIVLHELGHAIAGICMGMEVVEITIGYGKNIYEFQLFDISWKIKQVPVCGAAYILGKSSYLYRSREFIISLAGPLTNLMLILLVLQFPKQFITFNSPDFYLFPGIILGFVNVSMFFGNLYPRYVNINGTQVPNDSLRMMKLPFLSAREVAGEISSSWLFDGYKLESIGNYQKAIESFNKAIQYDRDCAQAYQRKGNAYHALKDDRQAIDNYQQAIACIDKTIKLEQLNAANYYARSLIYYDWRKIDGSRMENAIEDVTKAISIDSNNHSFYYIRAALYCYSSCESQAIEDFTTLIKLNPEADAYYNRGVTYYQAKKYQSAIEDLDMVINLDGSNISAYYGRGNAKYQLQDKVGAFEDYDRAKFLSSTATITHKDKDAHQDEHGLYAMGIAYIRLGNKAKAIEYLQIAESLCLDRVNTSLLEQIREELEKIDPDSKLNDIHNR